MGNPTLLIILGLALGVAFLGAALAVKLRQSPIIGYILAGILISPSTPGFVGDASTVDALANIGVILLLFSIGMEISVSEMWRSKRVAGSGTTISVLLITGIADGVGRLLGWSSLDAISRRSTTHSWLVVLPVSCSRVDCTRSQSRSLRDSIAGPACRVGA